MSYVLYLFCMMFFQVIGAVLNSIGIGNQNGSQPGVQVFYLFLLQLTLQMHSSFWDVQFCLCALVLPQKLYS